MTAPDHTPYLLPTDLRTAEDALAWQADCVLAWVPEHSGGRMPAGSLVQLLAARLDRERRQACRRGAEDYEQRANAWRRDADTAGARREIYLRLAKENDARALAFRAAARAK